MKKQAYSIGKSLFLAGALYFLTAGAPADISSQISERAKQIGDIVNSNKSYKKEKIRSNPENGISKDHYWVEIPGVDYSLHIGFGSEGLEAIAYDGKDPETEGFVSISDILLTKGLEPKYDAYYVHGSNVLLSANSEKLKNLNERWLEILDKIYKNLGGSN